MKFEKWIDFFIREMYLYRTSNLFIQAHEKKDKNNEHKSHQIQYLYSLPLLELW